MRAIIQRVSQAEVIINQQETKSIGRGLVVLLGIEDEDTHEDIEWLASKILNLRIMADDEGKMNLSVEDIEGEIMLISQFTLHASTKKGNRPSFIQAAKPNTAIPLYHQFISYINAQFNRPTVTGEFGAHMHVTLTNDGPVTIIIDTKNKV